MDSPALADAAPGWAAMQGRSPRFQFDLIAMFVEAIADAIEIDHREPDPWESMHLSYAILALAKARHYAALTFARTVLTVPPNQRPGTRAPGNLEVVNFAQLRRALTSVRVRRASPL